MRRNRLVPTRYLLVPSGLEISTLADGRVVPTPVLCSAQSRSGGVTQEEDGPPWLNKGPIGPPIAHKAAWIGALSCAVLAYFLSSLGYLSRNMIVVKHKWSDEEH